MAVWALLKQKNKQKIWDEVNWLWSLFHLTRRLNIISNRQRIAKQRTGTNSKEGLGITKTRMWAGTQIYSSSWQKSVSGSLCWWSRLSMAESWSHWTYLLNFIIWNGRIPTKAKTKGTSSPLMLRGCVEYICWEAGGNTALISTFLTSKLQILTSWAWT